MASVTVYPASFRYEEPTGPYTWLLQSYMFDPALAASNDAQVNGYPRFGDINQLYYDSNGDVIFGLNDGNTNSSQWPSKVIKVRRPKGKQIGGDIEWTWIPPDGGVGDITYIYHDRVLGMTSVWYKNKFYILDSGGNLINTVTPAMTLYRLNRSGPNAMFYNDKQLLVASYNGFGSPPVLAIINIPDGSVAWSWTATCPSDGLGCGLYPTLVYSSIGDSQNRVIYYAGTQNYVQSFSFSVSDQYTLPPASPSPSITAMMPYPGAIAPWRGGSMMFLDYTGQNPPIPYLHFVVGDSPSFSIPFFVSNNIDFHPWLPRILATHNFSMFELDLNSLLTRNPWKDRMAQLYSGQPGTSPTFLGWNYTRVLRRVMVHVNNGTNQSVTVSPYYLYSSNNLLTSWNPEPTPITSTSVSAGASADIAIEYPSVALAVYATAAAAISSGNLTVYLYGESL